MIGVRGPNSRRVAGERGPVVRAWKEEGRGESYWKLLSGFFRFFFFFLSLLV